MKRCREKVKSGRRKQLLLQFPHGEFQEIARNVGFAKKEKLAEEIKKRFGL